MITSIIQENDKLILVIQLVPLILKKKKKTTEIKIAFSRHLELRIFVKKRVD